MNKYIFLLAVISVSVSLQGQVVKECGTKPPLQKPVITDEMRRQVEAQRMQISAPYPIRVFIRVFADDDGTNLAATEADVFRQLENMRGFFQPHNICFILSGYEIIPNSDLNSMNTNEADDYSQLLGLALTNSITLFVHSMLVDNDGNLNGSAYNVPNHFLSLVSTAVSSTTNLSTMAHEMGHCLGLLHTFETAYGLENVARTGSCTNCDEQGDLLCDTEADLNNPDSLINTSCVYTGSAMDLCGVAFKMEETNIMTYGRRSCRDHFTGGQGAVILFNALTTHQNRIADDDWVISNGNITAGFINYTARNFISFSPGSFVVIGTATVNFSSRVITFSPGVDLKPATGYVVARAGTYCQ